MRCAIFDLDGLMADCTHRLHHIQGEDPDWEKFYLDCEGDGVIHPSVDVYNALMDNGFRIVVSTGRGIICLQQTMAWFRNNSIPSPHRILMRLDGCYVKDYVLKEDHVKQMLSMGLQPVMAFDDRDSCIEMFSRYGILCYQLRSAEISKTVDAAEEKE